MSRDPHAKRRVEVAAVSVAIVKTLAKIERARVELSALERRLAAQEGELRFQKLMLRFPYANPPFIGAGRKEARA